MARVAINTGATPNDGTGDSLRAAGGIINNNFLELYTYLGAGTTDTLSAPIWNTNASGINTSRNVGLGTTNPRFALEVGSVGASGTSLWVNGNARITGILTIGTSSITLDGSTNTINVGSGITINGNTGIISVTSIVVGGSTLTGSGVTSITAGSGISVDQSTGNVTISATGGGGGVGLSSFSASVLTPGISTLTYNNSTGVFSYTPPDLTGYATTSSIVGFITSGASGSNLSGIVTSITAGSGITINQSTGNVTISANSTSSQWVTAGVGIHTLSNVGIGTTNPTSALTVSGNANITGVVTATTFVGNLTGNVTGNATGLSGTPNINVENITANRLTINDRISLSDGSSYETLVLGNNNEFQAFHLNDPVFGKATWMASDENNFYLGTKAEGSETFYNALVGIMTGNDTYPGNTGYVYLGYGEQGEKFRTIGAGVTITGTTFTNQLSVSGVVTATTFVGNFSGSITDATNLTGGTANASSLNVSGIATISQGRIQADASANLRFGNLPTGSGSGRNIAIGDQVLVSLSGGQGRNIGIGELSYYDTTTGQYNIGIGERAGQKVTTGAYNVILGAYDGNSGNLDIRTSSNNVVIADGQGNIRQYINSSGNVGIKTTIVTEALTVAGVVSATSFYGTLNAAQLTGALPALDGSALTGVTATGTGVEIQEDGSSVGTAATINFGSNLNVTFASGIATVSGASSVSAATTAYNLAGSPNITVGTINSGNITAGLFQGTHNDAPIQTTNTTSTSQNNGLARFFAPNLDAGAFNAISFGKNNNLWETALLGFYWDGNSNNNTDSFVFLNLAGRSSTLVVHGNDNIGIGSIKPTSKLDVVGSGKFTGVVTATTFYGNLIGSITDAINLTGGYANASQLNVSGVTTISQGRIQVDASANLRFGNLPAGSGSGRNIAIGDQVLASLSGGQGRNIGIGELSYYDTTTGQYNIGIGERAGQKVSTGSYNVILGAYDGNSGGLDIRTSSRNVVIADGEGNIRQYINSSGNVGIKTTVVTEALTVAGVVSATSFYGTLNANQLTGVLPAIDGSNLFGVTATGAGVEIRDDGSIVGTAATIDFGSNLNVSFGSGVATVSVGNSVSFATTAYNLAGTPNVTLGRVLAGVATFRSGTFDVTDLNGSIGGDATVRVGGAALLNGSSSQTALVSGFLNAPLRLMSSAYVDIEDFYGTTKYARFSATSTYLNYNNSKKIETTGYGVTVYGGINSPSGIVTASSFSGSGSGLTNLPSGQLTGALPALDGSALINLPAQPGDGVNVRDDNTPVGSARTVNFGTGLDVAISGGIATITASGGSLQSRTTVSGVTTSIANNGIGNTNITGFKSYALMRVGLSTAGWLRLYTDSTSRANDISRSVGEDPAPGSGVIAEVVTTGISTTQIISPFVMGGNLDNPADTTIYAAITNLSGSTQAITANLTILQLEA